MFDRVINVPIPDDDVIKTVTNKLGLTKQTPVDQKKLDFIQNAVDNLGKEKTQTPLAVLNHQK